MRFFLVIMILGISARVEAQDFWLQPDKFFYKTGEESKISFRTGDNLKGQSWDLKKENILKLEINHLTGSGDLKALAKAGEKENLIIPVKEEGTQLIILQTRDALITSEATGFNAYLKDYGLDEVIAQRKKTGTTESPVNEKYACFLKLMVQVGDAKDETFKNIVGLPIEIVPDKNPFAAKIGDMMHFKILFQGKPLFGAQVKIWNHNGNLTTTQRIFTQQDGTIEMPVSNSGSWLLNVTKMVPLKSGEGEWKSFRASLMFGIK
jgi:uncharacterized GH25 family protein